MMHRRYPPTSRTTKSPVQPRPALATPPVWRDDLLSRIRRARHWWAGLGDNFGAEEVFRGRKGWDSAVVEPAGALGGCARKAGSGRTADASRHRRWGMHGPARRHDGGAPVVMVLVRARRPGVHHEGELDSEFPGGGEIDIKGPFSSLSMTRPRR